MTHIDQAIFALAGAAWLGAATLPGSGKVNLWRAIGGAMSLLCAARAMGAF